MSIEHLEVVNKIAKKLETRGGAWKLHAELIAFEGTPVETDVYCKKHVTEEGGENPKQKGVRVRRAMDGLRTISITDTQRKITDLEKPHDTAIASEDHPRSEALREALERCRRQRYRSHQAWVPHGYRYRPG